MELARRFRYNVTMHPSLTRVLPFIAILIYAGCGSPTPSDTGSRAADVGHSADVGPVQDLTSADADVGDLTSEDAGADVAQTDATDLSTYLAACSFYATLANASPVGLGDGGLDVTEAERAHLQAIAWDTRRARTRGEPPLVGTWPLSVDPRDGHDQSPGFHLELGGAEGPPGIQATATQFGYPADWHRAYLGIPHFPGLDVSQLTLAFRAHRADWATPTDAEETFVARHFGYRITQKGTSLQAELDTTDQERIGTHDTSPPAQVTAALEGLSPGWHRFAITYDGAELVLWVDGEPQSSAATTGEVRYEPVYGANTSPPTTPHFAIHSGVSVGVTAKLDRVAVETYETDSYLSAAMADLALFDRALDAAELDAFFPPAGR